MKEFESTGMQLEDLTLFLALRFTVTVKAIHHDVDPSDVLIYLKNRMLQVQVASVYDSDKHQSR